MSGQDHELVRSPIMDILPLRHSYSSSLDGSDTLARQILSKSTFVDPSPDTILTDRTKFQDLDLSPWTVFQLYYDAYQLIWTIILLFGVMVRVRSSFIALIWVFFASLGNFLKTRLFGKWRGKNVPINQEELA
jgi:hypothetical protein